MFSVYKNKSFSRFARKARISDSELWTAASQANRGLIDADLGGGVIKQRVARSGEGKSGGSRSIILLRKNNRAVFVYGFEKKDQANIKANELGAFRELAELILRYSKTEIAKLVNDGALYLVQFLEKENG